VWGDAAGCALVLLAMRELSASDARRGAVAAVDLSRLEGEVGGVYSAEKGWAEAAPLARRGPIVLALAARAVVGAGGPEAAALREQASSAVRSLFRDTTPMNLVTHMPWLGEAELLLAGEGEVPAATALVEMRAQCWRVQVQPDEDPGSPDLVGGLALRTSGTNLPTWHTLRPACFLARMVGDARLTRDDELLREVGRLSRTLRFVRQLTVDEYAASLSVDPPHAMWGVRAAAWDPEQPVDASAMALLVLEESVGALDAAGARLSKGRGAAPATGPR
jgi:hypothetical protein